MDASKIEARLALGLAVASLALTAYEASDSNLPDWLFLAALALALALGAWWLVRTVFDIVLFLTRRYRKRVPRLPPYPELLKRHKPCWDELLGELANLKPDLKVIFEKFLMDDDSRSRRLSRFEITEAYKSMAFDEVKRAAEMVNRSVRHIKPRMKLHVAEVYAISSTWSEADRIEWYTEIDTQEAQDMKVITNDLLKKVDKGIAEAVRRQELNLELKYTEVSRKTGKALRGLRELLSGLEEAASNEIEAWGKYHASK